MQVQTDDSAARLAAIVKSSDDAIVGKDLNGIITSWNAAAERMFGYTAAEAVGHSIHLIIPPDRRGEEDFVLSRVRDGVGVDHFETVRRRKDGTLLDISLTAIGRNADALIRLVDDVFETSAIVTGKLRLKLGHCDLSSIVSDAVEIVRPDAEAKGLSVVLTMEPGLIISCDAHRVRQALWNILGNAVKFTRAGHVRVTTVREGDRAKISLEDTGIGIAPESLPHIFERFWQADVSDTREYSGLGLGLSLARHFIELHGGQITARSAGIGHGTTFDIRVPLRGSRSAASETD